MWNRGKTRDFINLCFISFALQVMQLKHVFGPFLVLSNELRSRNQIKLHPLLSLTLIHNNIKPSCQQIFYNLKLFADLWINLYFSILNFLYIFFNKQKWQLVLISLRKHFLLRLLESSQWSISLRCFQWVPTVYEPWHMISNNVAFWHE